MKITKILFLFVILLFISLASHSQDIRTTETKVADLLARMPSNDPNLTNKLMKDMTSLGEEGIREICDMVVPYGKSDDTRPRFAIESLSRFLSGNNKGNARDIWEKICIDYANVKTDYGVKDFFMKQLQQFGGIKSAEAMQSYLISKEINGPALSVITSCGGKDAEAILAEALKNKDIQCPAAIMNTLAGLSSQMAVNEYVYWASLDDVNIKASAYNALAASGNPLAYDVLMNASGNMLFRWDASGATASLLKYAREIGMHGDTKSSDRICKLIMSKCNDAITVQNKTSALYIYVNIHGINAMDELMKAVSNPLASYRKAALIMSLDIPGGEVTKKWLGYFPKAIPEARPEIIYMLGLRGDKIAIPQVTSSLSDQNVNVRKEAASAIVKLNGAGSIPALIDYLMKFEGEEDQAAAKSALMTTLGNDNISLLRPVLKSSNSSARKSAIELIAWNKSNEYFNEIFQFTSSPDEPVQTASFKALALLAGPADQHQLIKLLEETDKVEYIVNIQNAIISAADKIADPEKRSSEILTEIENSPFKVKLIPILAKTGGKEALKVVVKEFGSGNSEIRDLCFKTLIEWKDFQVTPALFDIASSGNKTFLSPAFDAYLGRVSNVNLTDEEKFLLLRKIAPYAMSAVQKNKLISEIGKAKTYQALYFISQYLDDPETSPTAAVAAMTIALPSIDSKAGLYGSLVRTILTHAVDKFAGQESEFNKDLVNKYINAMPSDEGFKSMFNGKDLSGWQGLVENPILRAKMTPAVLAKKQTEADKKISGNWSVKDGCIWFNGAGDNLCSVKQYGDFEMLVDWKITKKGDSGIYLRGSPQVQIWDTSRVEVGAQVGSGGLYNNQKNVSKPLKVADNPVGEWNTFRIVMTGEKVSVWLNGELVVDNVTLENYWDRNIPIFPNGAIELQAHGTDLAFRDIYIREISDREFNLTPEERSQAFTALFNGRNLDNWIGNKQSYAASDGMIVVKPLDDSGGNLYTEKEFSDFIFRFEFQLTPAANNGIGIRAPLTGDAAYEGMEIQVLDNTDPVYANLQPYQYHGSVYGVIPARREFLKPVGEWNYEEITAKGTKITVVLNGTVIVDGDIEGPGDNGTMDHKDHPGLKNQSGHIGFLGHGSLVNFRNIRIKELK